VRRAAKEALHSGGWDGAATIDVLLRDEDAMRSINARSRGVEESTDVLSFPLFDLHPGEVVPRDPFMLPPGTLPHLGDVVVCISRAGEQALEYGHSFERELAYLTVHGVLHLLGYDHEEPADRRMMRECEELSLAALGLPRPG
jgi:probable rRNA maturation factor